MKQQIRSPKQTTLSLETIVFLFEAIKSFLRHCTNNSFTSSCRLLLHNNSKYYDLVASSIGSHSQRGYDYLGIDSLVVCIGHTSGKTYASIVLSLCSPLVCQCRLRLWHIRK